MAELRKEAIIETLKLEPHIQGGYFKRTYTDPKKVFIDSGSQRVWDKTVERPRATAIHYLLTSDSPINHFIKNRSDILHCYHLGLPIQYVLLHPDRTLQKIVLGPDILAGQTMQLFVASGCWKAARLWENRSTSTAEFIPSAFKDAGSCDYGLITEVVIPGFDYADMELATESLFKSEYPNLWDELKPYVRK